MLMIPLSHKIDLLVRLGEYMLSNDEKWIAARQKAVDANPWFTPAHIQLAIDNIITAFLQKDKLDEWASQYSINATVPKKVGIVMAGNIPLVGFHDLICGFISGHDIVLKLSSKDNVLLPHLIGKLNEWTPETAEHLHVAEMLKGCDAYIATGSNNSARYFEQYFAKYPHIIRRNRTSVAVLQGNETNEELKALGDDVFQYFGLGCRNVTQVYVPEGYDFVKLLESLGKYDDYVHHNKYKNNYDYQLAIYLLNKVLYMTNGSVLMVENALPFSAVSVLHYQYYKDWHALMEGLKENSDIQAIVGHGATPFGKSQQPSLNDYADGVDTMAFLCSL